jgi:hypothetical protein
MNARPSNDLAVGAELTGLAKTITHTRIQWYDSGMLSSATGVLARVGANIHTDDDFAKNQGLPAAIADGMSSTNWCQTMLIQYFGMDYIERGELRTKFIKPIFVGSTVFARARVLSVTKVGIDTEYKLDVWCDDEKGVKVVDGDARVVVKGKR